MQYCFQYTCAIRNGQFAPEPLKRQKGGYIKIITDILRFNDVLDEFNHRNAVPPFFLMRHMGTNTGKRRISFHCSVDERELFGVVRYGYAAKERLLRFLTLYCIGRMDLEKNIARLHRIADAFLEQEAHG